VPFVWWENGNRWGRRRSFFLVKNCGLEATSSVERGIRFLAQFDNLRR
jgi:hypothetical protein